MPKPSKTQKTSKGAEIPVPTRGEVYRDLEKVAKPQKKGAAPGHRKAPPARPSEK